MDLGTSRRSPPTSFTNGPTSDSPASAVSPAPIKSFVCLNCRARKVRCGKERPACAACQRRRERCVYEDAEAAGLRKRKVTKDANERHERRIFAQRGLNTEATEQSTTSPATNIGGNTVDRLTAASTIATAQTGRLIVEGSNTRRISSTLWLEVESYGFGNIDEENIFDAPADSTDSTTAFPPASLSRGLLGTTENLLKYHPSATDATRLWTIYAQNVEPLYKFLHTPTTQKFVATKCQDLLNVTSADQCLLFAIYFLAVFSMTEDACLADFGQARALLLSEYNYSIRQALFNASWLSVSNMSTLLAFVMYLSVVRRQVDPRSLWIWTGMGIRIMQRMGIHRDGEGMGLRPFDVELRRRLYWHLVSLDTYAGRISGTSDAGPPNTWDTKLPSNINDDQIHPEMTEVPCVRPGATDMMFSLVGIKLGTLFTPKSPNSQGVTEKIIDAVEDELELEFLRYCNPVEPVHLLTFLKARAAIATARLRRLVVRQTPDRETELYDLTRQIIEAENHTFTNPLFKPFELYFRESFRWDAIFCLLAVLARPSLFTSEQCKGSWQRICDFYTHHPEILEARDTLQKTIGRMTLMAWLANAPPCHGLEPEYITTLRTLHADSVAAGPSRHADGDAGKANLNLYPPLEQDSSNDITMFLNNDVDLADYPWNFLFDGVNYEL